MPTLKERIDAAKAKLEADKQRIAEMEQRASEPPKRQASRDVTQIREILVAEINLRRKYGCGYSGLAEIARKAKKDGIEPVAATGQKVDQDAATQGAAVPPPPPLPQQVVPAVGGVTSTPDVAFVDGPDTIDESAGGDPTHPLNAPTDDELAGVSEIASAMQTYEGPPTATEFDPEDEPPVENTPELAAAQRDDLPWDD